MQYRTFGTLDWKPSALGFGCMRLPTTDGKPENIDQEKTEIMIHSAIEAGVNYFDTAWPYHNEKSELAVGKAMQGIWREKVSIATKAPLWLLKESADFDRYLDQQLERLQMDHIDFYLLHALNAGNWAKMQQLGILPRAEAALADGRIRHFGFSFHDNLDTFKKIVDGYDRWEFCQIQYNYMDPDYQAGVEGLRYAAARGLGVIIMEPLLGGKLALELPSAQPLWESAPQPRTPAGWALQWLWSQPEVSLVLSGMSTLEQVQQNIASAAGSRPGLLGEAELALLDRVRDAVSKLSPIPCTSCEYCLPCPNGVAIPRNFDIYNKAAMFDDLAGSRFGYQNWIPEDAQAAACIQCEECLPKCPQNIPISSWLTVVEDVLGKGQPYVQSL